MTTFGEGTVGITRVFDAPRALVWQAWTDPKMMAQWFGPRGFTSSVPELDVRVGGALRIVMHGPDGNDYPMKGVFREVVAPERLVFSNIAIDNDGNHLLEGETTVTLIGAGRQDHADAEIAHGRPGADRAADARRHEGGLDAEHRQAGRAGGELISLSPLLRGEGSLRLTAASKPPTPAAPRSPTAPPRSSGCGAARRGRSLPPSPATAPGRCG